MSKPSLQNLENYKLDYTHGTTEIFTKYTGLIGEYIVQYVDSIKFKNKDYYKYILIKGLETITHVFKIIILYTKNLNIAYNLCQKSLYYYVEFICQIGDDNHSFLQLNSKDAALFVYKKTIFEINNEYRKEFISIDGKCTLVNNLNILIDLYTEYMQIYINEYSVSENNNTKLIKYIEDNFSKFLSNILNLSLNIDDDIYNKKLDIIKSINNIIPCTDTGKMEYIILSIKKLQSSTEDISIIKKNILNINKEISNRATLSADKYINILIP